MNAIRAIYHDGACEFIEPPVFRGPVEVLIIFPQAHKTIKHLRGLCQETMIDDAQIECDLRELNRQDTEICLPLAGRNRTITDALG